MEDLFSMGPTLSSLHMSRDSITAIYQTKKKKKIIPISLFLNKLKLLSHSFFYNLIISSKVTAM